MVSGWPAGDASSQERLFAIAALIGIHRSLDALDRSLDSCSNFDVFYRPVGGCRGFVALVDVAIDYKTAVRKFLAWAVNRNDTVIEVARKDNDRIVFRHNARKVKHREGAHFDTRVKQKQFPAAIGSRRSMKIVHEVK